MAVGAVQERSISSSGSVRGEAPGPSSALLTDQYELTMVDAALQSGVADRLAVFEVWTRSLPKGRRYGVVAGTARLLDAIANFRFGPGELDFLATRGVVDAATLAWLAEFRFSGDIDGYPEGELYFGGSPVLTVTAPFAQAILLETVILSVLNHDCAIASAAARMVCASGPGAGLIEMGSRRTHEHAAVAAARAAHIAGFTSTSNLSAGKAYGVPTAGTVAHAFILAHGNEREAFVNQLRALGNGTTLLVDTYDTEAGLRNAVLAARSLGAPGPGAVRIDSGDLLTETRRARALLDELGATDTRIVVSGDLDERVITDLEHAPGGRAPVDAYGVGTALVTGSGHPAAGFIYKLVTITTPRAAGDPRSAHDAESARGGQEPLWHAVSKTQEGKATVGGRKHAFRLLGPTGLAEREVLVTAQPGSEVGAPRTPAGWSARPLQVPLVRGGRMLPGRSLDGARGFHRDVLAELTPSAREVAPGPPAIQVELTAP